MWVYFKSRLANHNVALAFFSLPLSLSLLPSIYSVQTPSSLPLSSVHLEKGALGQTQTNASRSTSSSFSLGSQRGGGGLGSQSSQKPTLPRGGALQRR